MVVDKHMFDGMGGEIIDTAKEIRINVEFIIPIKLRTIVIENLLVEYGTNFTTGCPL